MSSPSDKAGHPATTSTRERDWDARLDAVIRGDGLELAFQPIVDLQRGVVAGYEALARFDPAAGFTPDRWFGEAAARGLAADLDAAVITRALATRRSLPRNTFLTINIEPESLLSPVVMKPLRTQSLEGVAIEVTEHRPLLDVDRVRFALEQLRSNGALIAVDDAGAGYSGLQQILTLRPQILKIDRAIVEGVDRDEAKAALVEMLGVFANRVDAWVLVEGVETLAEARRCVTLGVPLAQGWYFGRPAPPWASIDPLALGPLEDLIGSDSHESLRPLLSVAPPLRSNGIDDAAPHFADADVEHLVVIDGDDRPRGVLTPEATLAGQILRALVVNVHTTPRELAHRLATSAHDRNLPVVVTDNAGRYIGTVTTTRLLGWLASH